jgi:hypothetical protein
LGCEVRKSKATGGTETRRKREEGKKGVAREGARRRKEGRIVFFAPPSRRNLLFFSLFLRVFAPPVIFAFLRARGTSARGRNGMPKEIITSKAPTTGFTGWGTK